MWRRWEVREVVRPLTGLDEAAWGSSIGVVHRAWTRRGALRIKRDLDRQPLSRLFESVVEREDHPRPELRGKLGGKGEHTE